MTESMIKGAELLLAMQGLLGVEHPACQSVSADMDEIERPGHDALYFFIRHHFTRTLSEKARATIACHITADPHSIELIWPWR